MSGTRALGGGSNAGSGEGSSGTNSGGLGGGGRGLGSITQASKKLVQSLKEIVNCPEVEIYAMLKECNMDPDEAVNRLLSQDPFHQVKSKREKKKENKDATGLGSRGASGTSNRGGRGGNDWYSNAILSQFSSSESDGLHAMPSYKKDSGYTDTSSSAGPGVVGNNINGTPSAAVSERLVENKSLTVNNGEDVPSVHRGSCFQSPWLGIPGRPSMADIVKMGRPHGTGSTNATRSHQSTAHYHVEASQLAPTPQELYSSQDYVVKEVPEVNVNSGLAGNRNAPEIDDWPQDEQPSTVSVPLVSEPQVPYEPYTDPSSLPFNETKHHLDEVQCAKNAEPNLIIPSKMQDESSGGTLILNDESHDSINSSQVHQHAYEQQEAEDVCVSVSSVATAVQQLSLSKDEEEERESPAVKIADHLQGQSADCSHLSFGSFGSGISAPLSGPSASRPPQYDSEETSTAADALSCGHTDSRNLEYYENEHLRTGSDGNSDHRCAASSGNYDMDSASQSEMLKQEAPEVVLTSGNEYSFPSSSTNYTFENSHQLNSSLSHSQISSQLKNLPPLSGIMSYPDSLPSSLLPSNVHADRDVERSYSPFSITPSMPTKFGSSALASINVPSGSMAEAFKTGNSSSPQLTQNIPASDISGDATVPQHFPVHPYSQPSIPFANMISYPFLPQNYTYMPNPFEQAIAARHQALSAGLLPNDSFSASSLPHSASVPSGYGAFGNSSSIPGNFSLSPPSAAAAPPSSSLNYEDILSSQYKDTAHLLALQQGLGPRAMQAVPASTYYSFQGQSHQPAAGYRQTQQPSQQYSNLGVYPNYYHSQSGIPVEYQQQMSRDRSLAGPRGQQQQQQNRQRQQMWQKRY